MDASGCLVPLNSDIAGIGVRIAVYLQASLAIVNSFLQEGDSEHVDTEAEKRLSVLGSPRSASPQTIHATLPEVRESEQVLSPSSTRNTRRRKSSHEFVKRLVNPEFARNADRDLERSLFITGWALVICALVQAFSDNSDDGLTDYHALVVLNLSFVNYWAGIELLRRRTDRSQLDERPGENRSHNELEWYKFNIPFKTFDGAWLTITSWLPFYLHATLFSIFGIIFWIRQDLFQVYLKDGCTSPTVYWIFQPIPLHNRPLKIVSLVFYFLSVIPVLNGVFTQLLSIFVAGILAIAGMLVAIPLLFVSIVLVTPLTMLWHYCKPSNDGTEEQHGALLKSLRDVYKSLSHFTRLNRRMTTIVYTGPIVYWIIATELLVRSNAPYAQPDEDNSKQWTYGQVMSLLTACMVMTFYYLQVIEKIQEKKEKKHQPGSEAGPPGVPHTNAPQIAMPQPPFPQVQMPQPHLRRVSIREPQISPPPMPEPQVPPLLMPEPQVTPPSMPTPRQHDSYSA